MRSLLIATFCLCFAAAPAGAQTNPPGYTAFDFAQQAKLRSDLGTWQCTSIPANPTPISFTETEQGNWFVAREMSAVPATSYERWSHTLKAYVMLQVFDSGASNVEQTTSEDPDNGTWTQKWPALDNQGRKRFDNVVSRNGNVLRSTTQFYDAKGQTQTSTTTCTKQ
jgi:hypothetical protein